MVFLCMSSDLSGQKLSLQKVSRLNMDEEFYLLELPRKELILHTLCLQPGYCDGVSAILVSSLTEKDAYNSDLGAQPETHMWVHPPLQGFYYLS